MIEILMLALLGLVVMWQCVSIWSYRQEIGWAGVAANFVILPGGYLGVLYLAYELWRITS